MAHAHPMNSLVTYCNVRFAFPNKFSQLAESPTDLQSLQEFVALLDAVYIFFGVLDIYTHQHFLRQMREIFDPIFFSLRSGNFRRFRTFLEHYRGYSDDVRTLTMIFEAFLTTFGGTENSCDCYKRPRNIKPFFLFMVCFDSHFFTVWTQTPMNWTLSAS